MMRSRKLQAVQILVLACLWACEPYHAWKTIPLTRLLVAPSDFKGEPVAVRGYVRGSHGRMLLFLTSEHARVDDLSHAVLLYKTAEGEVLGDLAPCDGSFVLVFGTFDELPGDLVGITNIERVVRYSPDGDVDEDCFIAENGNPLAGAPSSKNASRPY